MYDVANVVDTVVSNLSLEYQNSNDNLDTDDLWKRTNTDLAHEEDPMNWRPSGRDIRPK